MSKKRHDLQNENTIFETDEAALVGPRIKELRTAKHLSVNKLANMTGVSQSYLRDVELGKKNPTVNFLSLICASLGVSLRDFFDMPGSEKTETTILSKIEALTEDKQSVLLEFLEAFT